MTETESIPLHERPDIHRRRWFLLAVLCLSLVMVVMSVSGLNVAIPSLQRSLDATATDLQWIVDSYAIVFAGLLLSAGALGDRFGRKRALVGGLAVFAGGSLLGVFAESSNQVIVSRVVMGVGAAFIMPATLSLVSAIFPPKERGKAIAIWAGFAGAGGALGPLIVGALLTEWAFLPGYWWGSAFVVNVVTGLAVLLVILVFSPESRDDDVTPLDPIGASLSLVGLAALLFAIIEGPERGWASTPVVSGFSIAVVALAGFVSWERRTTNPMLPMKFFGDRGFSVGSGVITFAFFVMFGFFFLVTQYFQLVRGYSPLRAGISTMPLAVSLVAVSPRSAALTARYGVMRVIAVGFAFLAVGLASLAFLRPGTSYVQILISLVILGAGMGITVAPATGSIMSAVPLNKAGVGSAVNDTTREVGGALGIAVLGSIATSGYRGSVDVSGVPAGAAEAAAESVGAAVGVGRTIGGDAGAALVERAGVAFTDAFAASMASAALIALVAGVVVLFMSRHRPPMSLVDEGTQPAMGADS